MRQFKIFLSAIFICALLGCQLVGHSRSEAMPTPLLDQAGLLKLVVDAEIADPRRSLVHLSHTCNLIIDRQEYAVIDMRELIKGAVVPRGLNQILVLNPGRQLVQKIEYAQARPLFCQQNKLYLYGKIALDGSAAEGNVLLFAGSGFKVVATQEDLNSRLPLPK